MTVAILLTNILTPIYKTLSLYPPAESPYWFRMQLGHPVPLTSPVVVLAGTSGGTGCSAPHHPCLRQTQRRPNSTSHELCLQHFLRILKNLSKDFLLVALLPVS